MRRPRHTTPLPLSGAPWPPDRPETGRRATPPPPALLAVVVEDDAALCAAEREVLEGAGFWVWALPAPPDPEDIRRLRPDLLVLDLVLDGLPGGWDYLRALRTGPPTHEFPILVCTGHADLARREGARLAELAEVVLLKPFGVDDLLAAVDACLRRPDGGADGARRSPKSDGGESVAGGLSVRAGRMAADGRPRPVGIPSRLATDRLNRSSPDRP